MFIVYFQNTVFSLLQDDYILHMCGSLTLHIYIIYYIPGHVLGKSSHLSDAQQKWVPVIICWSPLPTRS